MIHILLVEANPYISGLLKSKIEMEPDLKVSIEAFDPQAAFELARRLGPDLLLVDIDSFQSEGLKLARELSQAFSATPVLLLSFFDDDASRAMALRAGIKHLVLKEANSTALLAAIRSAVLTAPG